MRIDKYLWCVRYYDLPESRVGAKLVGLYCTDNTPEEAFEQAKAQQQAQEYYRQKGEGRPTKKDRRELEEFLIGGISTQVE